MKRRLILMSIWTIVALVSFLIVLLSLNQKTVDAKTPLSSGVGLVPMLALLGIVASAIVIKTSKKYVYDWYPTSKI
jgi:hypothetical protein